MEVKIARAVKKGGVNINNKLPYKNMEETLYEYITTGGKVFLDPGTYEKRCNPQECTIIGNIIAFDTESITINLDHIGHSIFDNDIKFLERSKICVNSNCDITDEYNIVNNILSLTLEIGGNTDVNISSQV